MNFYYTPKPLLCETMETGRMWRERDLSQSLQESQVHSMKQDECFVKRTIPVSLYYSPKRILCEAGQTPESVPTRIPNPLCVKLDSVESCSPRYNPKLILCEAGWKFGKANVRASLY